KKQTAAEELIPLVGRLYRENDVLLTLFGRSLLNKSVTGMIKAHRYARHFLGEDLDIEITHRIVKALAELDLAPARIDLGRLVEKLEGPNADIEAFLAEELRSEGTRLNSSHVSISYAVFCLKKKKQD